MEDDWFLRYPGLAEYPADKVEKDWFHLRRVRQAAALLHPLPRRPGRAGRREALHPQLLQRVLPMLDTETLSLWEHFKTMGAWNKTHETAWLLQQTRTMLVSGAREGAVAGAFVTSNWLKDGMTISVQNAPSNLGPVGYKIVSHAKDGYIEAVIDPPSRNAPEAIVIRLRHPDGKRIKSVTVDGARHKDFDPARDCIRLRPTKGRTTVRAMY